jgi:hypothetical protein
MGILAMVHSNRKEIDIGDITVILPGQKTTTFQKRKKKAASGNAGDETSLSFSVITHHGTLDFIALKEADAQIWVRTLTLLNSALQNVDGGNDKFYRYIQEQWNRADVDRSDSLSLDECVTLMRKMNCEVAKKKIKEKMKGKSAMTFVEYQEMMSEIMANRPEITSLIKEIKQQYTTKNKGAKSDPDSLTTQELLFFLNTMQRLPKEPEVTAQQVFVTYFPEERSSQTISLIQFARVLDHNLNSVVDTTATSPGCGDQVMPIFDQQHTRRRNKKTT